MSVTYTGLNIDSILGDNKKNIEKLFTLLNAVSDVSGGLTIEIVYAKAGEFGETSYDLVSYIIKYRGSGI